MDANIGICILLGMIFLHILDDFVLQSFTLSKLKQKKTWERYCHERGGKLEHLYEDDYLVANAIHALSWSICIMLPWIFLYGSELGVTILVFVIVNTIIHAYVDDLKANKEKINLSTDQVIHSLQIIITWFSLCFVKWWFEMQEYF